MSLETSEGFYLHHLPRFALLQDFLPGATVLQLGPGLDYDAHVLTSLGAERVVNVSPAGRATPDRAGRGEHAGGSITPEKGISSHTADYHRLPFADHRFDIVLGFEALLSTLDLPRAMAELKRILTPEGFIVLSAPQFPRDEVREIMGEGDHRSPYRSPAELYETVSQYFRHVTPLYQTPFFGYTLIEHRDGEVPKPFNISYDLLQGRSEKPLFYLFMASDLEIILEEDRLIQVPFSHMVNRIQEGLRTFHRSLERKNSALLEMREEMSVLRRDTDQQRDLARRLKHQLGRLVNRLETITQEVEPLVQGPGSSDVREGIRRIRERVTDLLAGIGLELTAGWDRIQVPTDDTGSETVSGSTRSTSMSQDEARLLTEGLQGSGIDDQLRRLDDVSTAGFKLPAGQGPQRTSRVMLPEDPVFQEDLAPFRLPGPVPMSTALREDLEETLDRLHQREAEIRQIVQWRNGLLEQTIELEARLRDELREGHTTWQLRQSALRSWEALIQLLRDQALELPDLPTAAPARVIEVQGDSDQAELFRALHALHQDESPEAVSTGPRSVEQEGATTARSAADLEGRTETASAPGTSGLEADASASQLQAERLAVWEKTLTERELDVAESEADQLLRAEALGTREESLNARQEQLARSEAAIALQRETLDARQAALEAREAELATERAALETHEGRLTEFKTAHDRGLEELNEYRAGLQVLEQQLVDRESALEKERTARAERLASQETRAVATPMNPVIAAPAVLSSQAPDDERDAMIAAREIELYALEERVKLAERRSAQLVVERSQLEAQVAQSHEFRHEATSTIDTWQQQLETAREEAGKAEALVLELRQALESAQQEREAQATALAELEARIEALYRQREALETAAEQAREHAAQQMQVAAGLDVMETELEELRGQLTHQQAELEGLREKAAAAEALEPLRERMRAVTELEATLADLQERLGTQSTVAAQALEETREAEGRRREIEQQLVERDSEVAELKDEVQRAWKRTLESAAGGPLSDLSGAESGASPDNASNSSEPASDWQKQLQAQSDKLEKLQKELDARTILLTRLQKELDLKSTHNRNLQEIIGKQREDLDKIKGKIREAIEYIGRLHQSNQDKDLELETLRKQLGRGDSALQA